MNYRIFFPTVFTAIAIVTGVIIFRQRNNQLPIPTDKGKELTVQIKSGNMKLTSSVFLNNQNIPAKYSCDGVNVNPPLTLSDVPNNAKSLVLIMDDPDAPMGTWIHWTVWNIDPKTSEIAENSVPSQAIEGKTGSGKSGYGGPCPPSGTHRYFFKLYALDNTLSLTKNSTKEELEKEIKGHILDQTELVGLYHHS